MFAISRMKQDLVGCYDSLAMSLSGINEDMSNGLRILVILTSQASLPSDPAQRAVLGRV